MKANAIKLSYHVIIGFILYKIMSLASNIVLSYKYGASQISDAYVTAAAIPVFIASAAFALTAGLFYTQAKKDKKLYIALALAITFVIGCAASATVYLYPDISVKIFAYGFDENSTAAVIEILKMTAFASIPILFICLVKSYMTKTNSTISALFESVPVCSAIIAGILISSAGNLNILGTSILAGYVLSALLMIFVLYKSKNKSESKSKKAKEKENKSIKNYIIFLAPVCFNILIYQIVYYFDRNIASTLSAGSISVLFYSQSVIQIVTSVLFLIITTNMHSMRRSIEKNNLKNVHESITMNINNIILVFVPISLFLVCFAGPVVMGLFERGAFTGNNRLLSSQILIAYALGILPMGLKFILDNIFFAYSDRKTPIITSAVAVLLNIGLDFLLVIPLKLFGIALASAISYFIAASLMIFKLKYKIDSEIIVRAVKNTLKVLISAVPVSIMVLIVFSAVFYSITSTLTHIILCMLSAAIVFVAGYRFTLKRICDDVDLHVNIKGLKNKEIIYLPSAATAAGVDIGFEIIKDSKYSAKQRIKFEDIRNLKFIKKVLQINSIKIIIEKNKKLFKEALPKYFKKAKISIYKKCKHMIHYIKNKFDKSEKKVN